MPRWQQILAFPAAYRLLAKFMGKDCRPLFVREYLRIQPGERVLDLGCGPGDILTYLPECEYVGVDIDSSYINAARKRFGSRGTFYCIPVENYVLQQPRSFDLVMATGVLHHLDDSQAMAMLQTASKALKPGGRLVTLDGCFVSGQSWVAKTLLKMDRGKYVRTEAQYLELVKSTFSEIQHDVRHDLLTLPYTLIIMNCKTRAV